MLIQEILQQLTLCVKAPIGSSEGQADYIAKILELMDEQIIIMQGLVMEADTSASEATAAALSAGSSASAADSSKNAAADSAAQAGTAAATAIAIRDEIHNLSAGATMLTPDLPAYAHYDSSTGALDFGIPKGDKGDQGIQGEQGPQGASIYVMGSKNSVADLPPTGNTGDG